MDPTAPQPPQRVPDIQLRFDGPDFTPEELDTVPTFEALNTAPTIESSDAESPAGDAPRGGAAPGASGEDAEALADWLIAAGRLPDKLRIA